MAAGALEDISEGRVPANTPVSTSLSVSVTVSVSPVSAFTVMITSSAWLASSLRSASATPTYKSVPGVKVGSGEIVTVHEGYPGHHMQIALVQDIKPFHPVESLFDNSAYAEGWARYAESLAEEADIYQSKSAKILRRTWPARGMVADTAMHLLGWSNQAVAKILSDSGKSFSKAPDVMMDRMAAMPAQLTAYDSGALEIFALRKEVETAQGEQFDIKQFHALILKNGNVPMAVLREQVKKSLN